MEHLPIQLEREDTPRPARRAFGHVPIGGLFSRPTGGAICIRLDSDYYFDFMAGTVVEAPAHGEVIPLEGRLIWHHLEGE